VNLPESDEHASCVRCGREVPVRLLKSLPEKAGGGLVCAPMDPQNYDACQRIYNTV